MPAAARFVARTARGESRGAFRGTTTWGGAGTVSRGLSISAAGDAQFLVVERFELVVLGLHLVALLLHLQAVVARQSREADEPERRRGVDGGALAPDEAARSEGRVFGEELPAL